jgi:hypothetical protein
VWALHCWLVAYWNSLNPIRYYSRQVFLFLLYLLAQTQRYRSSGDVTLPRLVDSYKHLGGTYCPSSWSSSPRSPGLLDPQYAGSMLLWDIGDYLLVDTMWHPQKTWMCINTNLWKPLILHYKVSYAAFYQTGDDYTYIMCVWIYIYMYEVKCFHVTEKKKEEAHCM